MKNKQRVFLKLFTILVLEGGGVSTAHASSAEQDCKQYGGQQTCVEPLPPKVNSNWIYQIHNSSSWGSPYPYFVNFYSEEDAMDALNSTGASYGAIGIWLSETCYQISCNSWGQGTNFVPFGTIATYYGPMEVQVRIPIFLLGRKDGKFIR